MNKNPVLKKCFRGLIIAASVVYALALLSIFFLSRHRIRYENDSFFLYLRTSVNLIPFKTIAEYATRLQNGTINFSIVFLNLFGNLVLFLPAGFLLPCLWERLRRFSCTFLTVFGIIFGVETLQLLLRLGAFDIDDFLLNLAGAAVGYAGFALLRRLFRFSFSRPSPES